MQLRHLNDLLHQRESELQSFSKERIENLRILESNKLQLKELEGKLKDFNKYEKMITTKFGDLESLMQELSITRTKYSQKETELKKGKIQGSLSDIYNCIDLENREIKLNEALRSIQELRIEKETLETQKQTLENENKDQCTEFNGKICGLNTEIKDKKRLIELLSGEKEVLLSDLKNITKDRDRIQRECSMALKEITDLAMNSECSAKDLSSLECSVAWIKGKCKELETEKISRDLDLVNLKQTVQELEKVVTIKNEELKQKEVEINKLKSDLDEFESVKVAMDKYENEISLLNEFKKKAQGLGFQDDSSLFDKIYEKLSHKTSERKLESLQNEVIHGSMDNLIIF